MFILNLLLIARDSFFYQKKNSKSINRVQSVKAIPKII